MNFPIELIITIICVEWIALVDGHSKLTALNDSLYASHLYRKLQNEEVPSERDSSRLDAQIRRKICDDLVFSGYFYRTSSETAYARELYADLTDIRFVDVFHLLYSYNPEINSYYEYSNPYRLRMMKMRGGIQFRENVFMCPLKSDDDDPTIPLYVSKEYNVGPFGDELYMPGRFSYPEVQGEENEWFLAEEPAEVVYTKESSNIELYYLRLRKYIRPAKFNEVDPLCKLVSGRIDNPRNQHHRLCVAVARSSYFADLIGYPEDIPYSCSKLKVSFRSVEALEEAAGDLYHERMTLCYSRYVENPTLESDLYISRAYFSNAIFVYQRDTSDGNIYLQNVSTNIGIVDEIDAFEFVEY